MVVVVVALAGVVVQAPQMVLQMVVAVAVAVAAGVIPVVVAARVVAVTPFRAAPARLALTLSLALVFLAVSLAHIRVHGAVMAVHGRSMGMRKRLPLSHLAQPEVTVARLVQVGGRFSQTVQVLHGLAVLVMFKVRQIKGKL